MEYAYHKYLQNPLLIDEISVDNLESWISKEPFNVVLQVLLSIKMGNLQKDNSAFGVRNTLYPHVLGGILQTNRFQNIHPQIVQSLEPETDLNVEMVFHSEEIEQTAVTQDKGEAQKTELYSTESLPQGESGSEKLPDDSESQIQNMVEPTLSHQIIIPEEIKIVKNPKKKKDKKMKDFQVESSSFTEWLLALKPIGKVQRTPKKKKKKDNIHLSAKKSITPSDDIISESLAKILKTQGHLLEAKKMFKKLMARHPENVNKYSKEIDDIIDLMENKE